MTESARQSEAGTSGSAFLPAQWLPCASHLRPVAGIVAFACCKPDHDTLHASFLCPQRATCNDERKPPGFCVCEAIFCFFCNPHFTGSSSQRLEKETETESGLGLIVCEDNSGLLCERFGQKCSLSRARRAAASASVYASPWALLARGWPAQIRDELG